MPVTSSQGLRRIRPSPHSTLTERTKDIAWTMGVLGLRLRETWVTPGTDMSIFPRISSRTGQPRCGALAWHEMAAFPYCGSKPRQMGDSASQPSKRVSSRSCDYLQALREGSAWLSSCLPLPVAAALFLYLLLQFTYRQGKSFW